MIGAAVAVFARCAAEFGHRQDHHVVGAFLHIGVESRQPLREFRQAQRELALRRALIGVRVPSADVREGDFKPMSDLINCATWRRRSPKAPRGYTWRRATACIEPG